VDVLQGFAGAAYRVGQFDTAELRRVDDGAVAAADGAATAGGAADGGAASAGALRVCHTVDDMWISRHLARRGVSRVLLPVGSGEWRLTEPRKPRWWLAAQQQPDSGAQDGQRLSTINHREHRYVQCVQALEAAFGPWPLVARL